MIVSGFICFCDSVNIAYGESKHYFKLTPYEPYAGGPFIKITSDEEYDTIEALHTSIEALAKQYESQGRIAEAQEVRRLGL